MYDLFTNKEVSSIADEISVEKKELTVAAVARAAGNIGTLE
jgi:hypothetical protein